MIDSNLHDAGVGVGGVKVGPDVIVGNLVGSVVGSGVIVGSFSIGGSLGGTVGVGVGETAAGRLIAFGAKNGKLLS